MSEKYGFIYIWRDRKHNRYYIGSHWGTENDGYICSSRWMRKSYRRRSQDFKRRIISRVTTSKQDLLEKEHQWLQLISSEKLGKSYYNLRTHHPGHWSSNPDTQSLRQKISEKTKAAMSRPEVREKTLEGYRTRNTRGQNPQKTKEKRRTSMVATMAKKFPVENRYQANSVNSEEHSIAMKSQAKKFWETATPEQKAERARKITEKQLGVPRKGNAGKGSVWWNNGLINTKSFTQPSPDWVRGRVLK